MTRLPTGVSRWQQLKRMLERAIELPPAEQKSYLDKACGGDPFLRRELESLVAHADANDFLTHGVARAAADALDLTETVNLEGAQLGPWKIAKRIGVGGMGAVYLAERADGEFTKQVAIKVVRQRVATEGALRRFRAERQILADIEHPNIARLIDAGTTDEGLPYLVMEYVEGEPIDQYCDDRRLTIEQRLDLFREVCAAVQLAHEQQIVHRDLKPSNVLITADGTPKLLDFGIAKLLAPELLDISIEVTAEFQRLLTPAFASPEQIRGEPVTTASDVYSLGVMLYTLLSGHSPYDPGTSSSLSTEDLVCKLALVAPSVAVRQFLETTGPDGEPVAVTPEVVSMARGTDPDRLCSQLASGLDAMVLKALAKDPAARYATAIGLGDAIQSIISADSSGASAKVDASPAGDSSDPRDGTTLGADTPFSEWGHLQVIRRIGEGIFGEVYECLDPSLKLTVALKLFRRSGDADADISSQVAQRILREGQLLARVRHPNVLLVHGAGVHDDTVGLWMEYIDGKTLEELLEVQGRFSAREASLIGIKLCGALAAVHGAGVIHRDVKAQNVIREEGGRIVLMDFGSGRDLGGQMGRDPGAAGTPLYMAPEVLRGGVATARSDIYCMGVLLFRLVTASFPVDADSWQGLLGKHESGEKRLIRDLRPDLGTRFVRVIEKALAKNSEHRFASAGEMQQALEAAADLSTDEVMPPSPIPLVEPKEILARARWAVGATALATVAVVFAAFFFSPTDEVFGEGERRSLLVAGFENETDHARIDDVIEDVLTGQLDQSPHFYVTPLRTVRSLLTEMGLPEASVRLDFDGAMEVCLRGSIPVLVTGRVEGPDSGLLLVSELWDVAGERVIRVYTEPTTGEAEDLFAAVERIAAAIREDTGEALATLTEMRQPASVWTSSVQEAQELYSLAEERRHNDDISGAITLLRRAVELDPGFAIGHARLGRIYDAFGDRPLALESLREALRYSDRLTRKESDLIQALYYISTEERDKEIAILEPLADLYPLDADIQHQLGQVNYMLGQYSMAREALQRAITIEPAATNFRTSLAISYLMSGDYEGAAIRLDELEQISPDSGSLVTWRGFLGLLSGNAAEAVANFTEYSRALDPTRRSRGYYHLAQALAYFGRYAEAEQSLLDRLDFSRGRGQSSIEAESYLLLSRLALERGDGPQAGVLVEQAIALPLDAPARALAGSILASTGQLEAATELVAQLEVDGASSTTSRRLAQELRAEIALASGELDRAIGLFESAKTVSVFPAWSEGLARALRAAGLRERAIVEYREITDRRGPVTLSVLWGPPTYAEAVFQIAQLYDQEGDRESARLYYEEYLDFRADADDDVESVRVARERLRLLVERSDGF